MLKLDIATGTSAKAKIWKNEKISWQALVRRLRKPVVTPETYERFISSTKQEQGAIKDVGGFVGGYLRQGRRHPQNVLHRQLLTLDLDFATPEFWDCFEMMFDFAAVLHSTHKHSKESPRYRLIIPLDREVLPDEYCAIARKVAGWLNINLFDKTTFEVSRLMFWPSVGCDSKYEIYEQDGEFLSADWVLEQYVDWTDSHEWPTSVREVEGTKTLVSKQEDPLTKRGLVGAFCRCYDIHEAISVFLSDAYEQCVDPNRYTYKLGSTSAGAIAYDDKFLYSHHGTDPISGHLCNAFDLVRIHLYGHMDDEPRKNGDTIPSFKEMNKLISKDEKVVALLAEERTESALYDFAEDIKEESAEPQSFQIEFKDETEEDWKGKLQIDKNGLIQSSSQNLNLILKNDPNLNRLLAFNTFDSKRYLANSAPWRSISAPEPIRDVDYSGLRNYLDTVYGISSNGKVDDAAALVFNRNSFHPIKQYLSSLKWDGVERVDTLLTTYLGADDNIYTREAIRKSLVAAVARVFEPGTKFDMALILVGAQGKGKSTFIRKLGKTKWFSDSFTTVQGKESFEQLQGAWLIEIAELSAFKKSEVEAVKQFISKQSDMFRPAYGRTVETFNRQCVFFGTSNPTDFLKDPTGNRRFNPIDVHLSRATKDVLFSHDLEDEVDQIWAEAMDCYLSGEALYLSPEASRIAENEQRAHSECDDRKGIVEDYLAILLPNGWDEMDLFSRRIYLDQPAKERDGCNPRRYVCTAEIWVECLGMDRSSLNARNTRELNDIMRTIQGWKPVKSTRNVKGYGAQRYYEREG